MKRALVIGQGGREHALVRALALSPSIEAVIAVPGSSGISAESEKVRSIATDWRDFESLHRLILLEKIDFVVVGPEVPLVDGLSDRLRERGVSVFGPSREGARLEGSKVYSKEFIISAGVPTARSIVVRTVDETLRASSNFSPPYVLKADGLAAGKGVFICKTLKELEDAAQSLFVSRSLGDAGSSALLEEFSPGYEISYLVLTNGVNFEPLVLAQDHKRLRTGDEGPNTGGMGVVAPVEIDPDLRVRINSEIVEPTLREMQKRSMLYRGVLYIGLMITPRGPSVIEYNARFGDPETQVILPLLDGDWGDVFSDVAEGRLPHLKWKRGSAACVVLAAEGYPDSPVKGTAIVGLDRARAETGRYFLHAGTRRREDGQWITDGGRVLNSIGLGRDLREALELAYKQVQEVEWKGMQFRTDIGHGQKT